MTSRELSKEIKPDLYPDIVAAGTLSNALAKAFADLGSPLRPEALINFLVFAQTERGSRFCQMYIAAHERLFIFDFWSKGVGYGKGSTGNLHDAAQAIHFWLIEQPDLARMQDRFDFFTADAQGLAHEAGRAVEYQWKRLRESWARSAETHPDSLSPLVLIEAALQQPELRQLFPFTSLYSLHFSRTTGYPFTNDCPFAVPLGTNHFRVYRPRGGSFTATGEILGEGNANEAIALLVSNLPPHGGPAIAGTANDLEEHP